MNIPSKNKAIDLLHLIFVTFDHVIVLWYVSKWRAGSTILLLNLPSPDFLK
jgi:hypothetical protein